MNFWDTSALVPLVVEEARSAACRRLLRVRSPIVVWALTGVEMIAAVERQARSGQVDPKGRAAARARIDRLARRWSEVDAMLAVREQAAALLERHDLRAADALQVAAAVVAARDRPKGHFFISADERLAAVARGEQFEVLVPAD